MSKKPKWRANAEVFYTQQRKWQVAIKRAWLRDHPGKTVADFELAGS
jgi:hypothetical protein